MNVHEGPQSISFRASSNDAGLHVGMVLSNEPGYYEAGKFGIRLETMMHVVEKKTPFNFGGSKFLGFEKLTFVPIDKSMVAPELMNKSEIEWLDEYHREVWNKISPLMPEGQAKEWLFRKTTPLMPNW